MKIETTVQCYKPNRYLLKKIGVLVFKKNTLLQNLNISLWFSQGIELLDDKLENLQEKLGVHQ